MFYVTGKQAVAHLVNITHAPAFISECEAKGGKWPGTTAALLAKREGADLQFGLPVGMGERTEKSPWLVEWGGGASIENPHVQRVHYCELLVRTIRYGPFSLRQGNLIPCMG